MQLFSLPRHLQNSSTARRDQAKMEELSRELLSFALHLSSKQSFSEGALPIRESPFPIHESGCLLARFCLLSAAMSCLGISQTYAFLRRIDEIINMVRGSQRRLLLLQLPLRLHLAQLGSSFVPHRRTFRACHILKAVRADRTNKLIVVSRN